MMDAAPQRSDKVRVLLVDDEFHVRTILKEMLADLNCEVVGEATTGVEAVEMFRQFQPDMMILDITMPQLSGEEVLMLIMTEFPDALVLILTSMTDENTVNSCLDLGAVNYIRKDTPLDEIKNIIRETLKYYYEAGEVEPG
jgi:two-component system, chemotaxis family, chemotaxis protein CheY